MKITLDLTPEQVKALLAQLTPDTQPQIPNTLTDYSKKYLTVTGLQELAKTEYQQYTTQEKTILDIANRIRAKQLSISVNIDPLFANKIPKQVANTLCNGNARIMLANNYLVRNGKNAMTFEEAYLKALKNKGFLPGALSSCNADIYRALLSDLLPYKAITENKPSNYNQFILQYQNQLIRAWTVKEGNPNDTHATMLYYNTNTLYCVDTASVNRNGTVDIGNLTYLHGRQIHHLETLIKQ